MKIGIIGAPVDLGADRRGVDMGASAIRYAGLETSLRESGHSIRDFGNVATPIAESVQTVGERLKYLEPILRMSEELSECVSSAVADGFTPVVLGGDHSVSLGSVAGVTRHRAVGVIWMDAHGDFNTNETSPSGNIHGMVLAALAGYGDERLVSVGGRSPKVGPQNIALVGTRELDVGERALILEAGLQVYTMHDIDRLGMPAVIELALQRVMQDVDGVHLSLDLDVVDPLQAPGVGTPVLGGLNYRETHLAMEMISQSGSLVSMDVVEVNPVLDTHNDTARQAMSFTLSAMGKKIM